MAKIGHNSWIIRVIYDEPVTILSYLEFNAYQVIHDTLYSMILSHPMFFILEDPILCLGGLDII